MEVCIPPTRTGVSSSAEERNCALQFLFNVFVAIFAGDRLTGMASVSEPPTFSLDFADSQGIREVLEYAYGRVKRDENFRNVFGVFEAAIALEWEELQMACHAQFQQSLSVDNCLSWLMWARKHSQATVAAQAAACARNNLRSLRDTPEYLQLTTEDTLCIAHRDK